MLFKDVLLLDDYVFSGKSLKQSLPQHQLSSLTKGKCMPKAESQPHERQIILLLPESSGGSMPLLPTRQCLFSKTIQSLHQDVAGAIWKGDNFLLFFFTGDKRECSLG